MNITLTDEHEAVIRPAQPGDTLHLVVAGEHLRAPITRVRPPAEWQQASGPCPTCGGDGIMFIPGGAGPCFDCIDGKRRVTLGVERWEWWEVSVVPLAVATVEVLPVVTWYDYMGEWGFRRGAGRPFVYLSGSGAACLYRHTGDVKALNLHRIPTPGADFVVAVTIVETP